MSNGTPGFSLITAIRYDPALLDFPWNTAVNGGTPSPFMLLRYHYDRLLAAASVHGWADTRVVLTWETLQRECTRAVVGYTGPGKGGPLKLRPEIARDMTFKCTVSPTPRLPADPMLASTISPTTDALPTTLHHPIPLYLDTQPTQSSVFTSTKTTRRAHYSASRARVGLPAMPSPADPSPDANADVLLYNTEGMLTETSLRNVALFRRGHWTAPSDATGGLRGTVRRWLIEKGRLVQDVNGILTKDNVQHGEMVLVFNGVEGCRLAIVKIRN